jgi:hypothetical protein
MRPAPDSWLYHRSQSRNDDASSMDEELVKVSCHELTCLFACLSQLLVLPEHAFSFSSFPCPCSLSQHPAVLRAAVYDS